MLPPSEVSTLKRVFQSRLFLVTRRPPDSIELFKLLNKIDHGNGVGRIDFLGTRLVGIKSRGCYDKPGLTIA